MLATILMYSQNPFKVDHDKTLSEVKIYYSDIIETVKVRFMEMYKYTSVIHIIVQ